MDRVVDEEPDAERIPLDSVPVETAVERQARQGMRERRVPRVPRTVHGRARRGDVAAVVFHNVELTTRRPANRLHILPQQPNGGPEALARCQFDSRFDTAR